MSPGGSEEPTRVLLVRHAQSANKAKSSLEVSSSDPGLSPTGLKQAAHLALRLSEDLHRAVPEGVLVVSSPMKRCLLTVLPFLRSAGLTRENCICHGGAYEFGCAGKAHSGSLPQDIEAEHPFRCVGFGPHGWDYVGDSEKETEPEARLRMERFARWLLSEGVPELRQRPGPRHRAMVVCMHQTVLDLLVRLLVDGSGDGWRYGDFKYKHQNTAITELSVGQSGIVRIIKQNDHGHLPRAR